MRGDAQEPVPGRDQQQPRDLVSLMGGSRCGDAGAERFADHQQRRAVQPMRQGDARCGIGDQAALAERALARPVARVFGQDHAQAEARQRFGVVAAIAGVPRIAVEDDRRRARRAVGRTREPAEVVRRRPRLQPGELRLGQRVAGRKVDQAILHQRDRDQQRDAEQDDACRPQRKTGRLHGVTSPDAL